MVANAMTGVEHHVEHTLSDGGYDGWPRPPTQPATSLLSSGLSITIDTTPPATPAAPTP